MSKAILPTFLALAFLIIVGCSEGPLWKTGSYVPWVREKWDAEEQIANTLYERKRALNDLVRAANEGGEQQKASAASELSDVVNRAPILLLRLHAVQLLGHLDHPTATEALRDASSHPDSQVRIAAVRGWTSRTPTDAVGPLQEIVGSDTNVDVRLAATKALGELQSSLGTNALALALTDSNPAVQLRATEALGKITGQQIGPNVSEWQSFLQNQSPQRTADASDTELFR